MFTGIVEAKAAVRAVEARGTGLRLQVESPGLGWELRSGESVSVCGACLTVLDSNDRGEAGATISFDLSAETLARTWFAELRPGRLLNLERALRLGDRLGGHLVSGHVDGLGRIVSVESAGDGGRVLTFELDLGLERYLIEKGSITLDGVSLTVVRPEGRRFQVALIPLTLDRTSFGSAEAGQRVNVEVDLVGKWIEKLVPR